MAGRRREPRLPPTHAEADREDVADAEGAQALDRGGHVGLNPLGSRLLDVLHVLEVVAALLGPGRSAEVVDSERRVAALCKAQCQLLVEAVEAAHVGEDHNADLGRLVRGREKRGEAVSVGGPEDEVIVRDSGPGDRGDRRQGIQLEAHGRAAV